MKNVFVLLPFADSFGEHSEEVAPDTPRKVYIEVYSFLGFMSRRN